MAAPGGTTDPELRAARRTLVLFVVALGAAAIGFVTVLVGNRGDDGGSTVAGDVAEGSEAPEAGAARIGPSPGESVQRHAQERTAALDEVEGRRVAVVSLTGYSTVETVADLLDGLELDRYLIALVGDGPRTTRDVEATIADVAASASGQLAELEELAPTVDDDPEFEEFYATEIARYRQLIESAEDDAVVFGLVVTGRASDLRALASRASVRLVDVGSSDRLERDAPVRGLRPEETATVGEPPFRR